MQKRKSQTPGKVDATKGRKSLQPIITIKSKYHKIYFSINAVDHFGLDKKMFQIFEEGGSWFFQLSETPRSLKLRLHQGAYYVVKRKLVKSLLKSFRASNSLKLSIEGSSTIADKYLLTQLDSEDITSGKRGPEFPPPDLSLDPRKVKAILLLDTYRKTEFQGRIKTLEIIRAENYLNQMQTGK